MHISAASRRQRFQNDPLKYCLGISICNQAVQSCARRGEKFKKKLKARPRREISLVPATYYFKFVCLSLSERAGHERLLSTGLKY